MLRKILLCLSLLKCGPDVRSVLLSPSVDERVKTSLSQTYDHQINPWNMDHETQIRFAVFGDPQIREENKHRMQAFRQAVLDQNLDFFIAAGDLTEDGNAEEFKLIKDHFDGTNIPYFVALGNHDIFQWDNPHAGWRGFQKNFGAATRVLHFGRKLKILILDTATGVIGKRQFEWLENELKQNQTIHTLLATHFPLVDGQHPSIWRLSNHEERYRLTHLLIKYKVKAYVSGHLHAFESQKIGSIIHLILGSMYPYALDRASTPGFAVFQATEAQLDWSFVATP
jgi:predicted phosphodiesterase